MKGVFDFMARIKSKRAAVSTLSCKFGGMGKQGKLSLMGAEDMCNLRPLPGGGVSVRSGYTRKKYFSSGKTVRGCWEGTIDNISYFFVVAGNTVYRLMGDVMSERVVGTLSTSSGSVDFILYDNTLYLLDGVDIMTYTAASKFEVVEPYVPLYGFAWSATSYGDINEQINLLTPRLRVHYFNTDGDTEFLLPFYADQVENVYFNGEKTENYTFSSGSDTISFPFAPTTLEVSFTVSLNEELRDALIEAQMCFIYSRGGTNQLMFATTDGRLFLAKKVESAMLSSCRAIYPKATSLYFCADDILFLGDNTHPITTICPLYETLLVFTSDRIWNLSFDKKLGIVTTLSMRGIGCASLHGAIPYKDGVLAAMNGGIYNITASPARPENLFLERLSLGIDDKFSTGFTSRVHIVRDFPNGEILLRDPNASGGEVWVWNTEMKEWYRFTNIPASFFFKRNNVLCFASGTGLFFFDRNVHTDNGTAIQAHYKSNYLDFGSNDAPRRSMRALLCASPSKSSVRVLFETEHGETAYDLTSPTDAVAPQLHDMRMHLHRYRFLRFTLSTGASYPTEFYKLDIYSRP